MMKVLFFTLLLPLVVQAQVACTAHGIAGSCRVGNECLGNWYPTIAGRVTGCEAQPYESRCCVPACERGVCAASAGQCPSGHSVGGSSTPCGAGAVCCQRNLGAALSAGQALASRAIARVPRLKRGDTVALVAVSSAWTSSRSQLDQLVASSFDPLGVQTKLMPNALQSNDGTRVAGTDAQRVADLHAAFSDPSIDAVWAITGGYGCTRLLDSIDYSIIRANPKPFGGYSDVTGCVAAIAWRAGIVAFIAPMAPSSWKNGNGHSVRQALQQTIPYVITSYPQNTPQTVVRGSSAGILVGGNLSLLAAMLGAKVPLFPSPDVPIILVIEDVGEDAYRVDRMLVSLRLAGIFDSVVGFVWGTCARCQEGSLWNVEEAVKRHMLAIGKPAVYNMAFGHHGEQFTLPVGLEAVLDADNAEIILLRSPTVDSAPSLSSYSPRLTCAPLPFNPSPPSSNTNCDNNSGSSSGTATECPQCMQCPTVLPCKEEKCECPPCNMQEVKPIYVPAPPSAPRVCPVCAADTDSNGNGIANGGTTSSPPTFFVSPSSDSVKPNVVDIGVMIGVFVVLLIFVAIGTGVLVYFVMKRKGQRFDNNTSAWK